MSVSVNFPTVFSALKDDLCKQMAEVLMSLGCVKLVFRDFHSPAFLRTQFFKNQNSSKAWVCGSMQSVSDKVLVAASG